MRFGRQAVEPAGFAVVDVESTGLYPSTDRVVEVAVVHVSGDGQITAEFSSLINPRRDVGPTRIHGIKAADVLNAPTFAQAARTLWQLLDGRVLVAHNVPFDARFLEAEFNRLGVRLPPPPLMCTMQLASYYLPGLPGRSLAACCAAANITSSRWHTALDDARAAALLLACYRPAHRQLPGSWALALQQAARASWIPAPGYAEFRPLTRVEQEHAAATQRPPLADFVGRLPRGATAELDSYLDLLDRVIEDRIIDDDEIAELSALAADLGLTRDGAIQAHRDYLLHLATAAWRDRVITDLEHADLLDAARLLGVTPEDALAILGQAEDISRQSGRLWQTGLERGARVVLTGDMSMGKDELKALAESAGLRVTGSVSGKTALLVAADPWSQSGKARAARQLGVRIVTEQVFSYYLEQILAGQQAEPIAPGTLQRRPPDRPADSPCL
jgi:DNA polymerase-3 subunit epsilon